MSRTSWWASKARQLGRHLVARVSARERDELAAWLRPPELELFDAMHVADRRHGLDVAAGPAARRRPRPGRARGRGPPRLREGRHRGRCRGSPGRSGEAYGPWVWSIARRVPGWNAALTRLETHAEASARLVESAGLPPFAVDLVRYQAEPRDPTYGLAFHAADEAC